MPNKRRICLVIQAVSGAIENTSQVLMTTHLLTTVLPTLMRELVDGAPDPETRTYMLTRGDTGLLAGLDQLSAEAASASRGGASIAAHVDHVRYGLSLLNQWAAGALPQANDVDWTA